jgi:hypothetical protein
MFNDNHYGLKKLISDSVSFKSDEVSGFTNYRYNWIHGFSSGVSEASISPCGKYMCAISLRESDAKVTILLFVLLQSYLLISYSL